MTRCQSLHPHEEWGAIQCEITFGPRKPGHRGQHVNEQLRWGSPYSTGAEEILYKNPGGPLPNKPYRELLELNLIPNSRQVLDVLINAGADYDLLIELRGELT